MPDEWGIHRQSGETAIRKNHCPIKVAIAAWAVIAFAYSGCERAKPGALILFIGSGMGVGHLSADYYLSSDSTFADFSNVALLDPRPLGERWITDAAAAATALATGEMVTPGTVSLKNDTPLTTLLEAAQDHQKATGVVTTASLTQAVSAAFLAHAQYWGKEYDLARQIAYSNTDVLLGGGRRFFEYHDSDSDNLILAMQDRGYTLISQQQQLETLDLEKTEKLLGLFAAEALRQADHRSLSLRMMTEKAVKLLAKNRNGFVLIVEGAQIDWRSHERDSAGLLAEMQDFANAIRWTLDYQKKHPNLLIVVTGLNDTGGVFLIQDNQQRGQIGIDFASSDHTANLSPVLAKGPRSERIRGIVSISELGRTLMNLIKY